MTANPHEGLISAETLDALGARPAPGGGILWPYPTGDVLDRGGGDREPRLSGPSIFNHDRVFDAQAVFWADAEEDVAALFEAGFAAAASAVSLDALAVAAVAPETAVLVVGDDGLRAALLERFGRPACRYVPGGRRAIDILRADGADGLRAAVEGAVEFPHEGLYGVEAYAAELDDVLDGKVDPPLALDMPGVDHLYRIKRGTFHVFTGIPNHGKSMFLDQVMLRLAELHDWRFAVFSPEQSPALHLRRMVGMCARTVPERVPRADRADIVEWLAEKFFFIEAKDRAPKIAWLLEAAKDAFRRLGCKGLVIDPYNEVDATRRGNVSETEHIKTFITDCKRFCRAHNATVWVVAHPFKMPRQEGKTEGSAYAPPTAYDISGSAHWHNQADAVVTIHRDFDSGATRFITRKIREQGMYGDIGESVLRLVRGRFELDEGQ